MVNSQIISLLEEVISRQELILSHKRMSGTAITVAEKATLTYLYDQLRVAHHFQRADCLRLLALAFPPRGNKIERQNVYASESHEADDHHPNAGNTACPRNKAGHTQTCHPERIDSTSQQTQRDNEQGADVSFARLSKPPVCAPRGRRCGWLVPTS